MLQAGKKSNNMPRYKMSEATPFPTLVAACKGTSPAITDSTFVIKNGNDG